MKPTHLGTLLFASLSLLQSACASERIFDVRENRSITRSELLDRIAATEDLIVGEKHDTAAVQASEARLFADFARGRGRVTFAWEFWSWSERGKLAAGFAAYRAGEISGEEFLRRIFGDKNPEPTYLPLMAAVKAADAEVLAMNLTRAEKAPVVKNGLAALDPKLLPPGFELGSEAYSERFLAQMGGHGSASEIRNYFAAQSLVDDVAAFHFLHDRTTPSAFLVIGNFHVRYFDGLWQRLEKRSGKRGRTLVEIADPEDEQDWSAILNHAKYGPSSDFIIFTR